MNILIEVVSWILHPNWFVISFYFKNALYCQVWTFAETKAIPSWCISNDLKAFWRRGCFGFYCILHLTKGLLSIEEKIVIYAPDVYLTDIYSFLFGYLLRWLLSFGLFTSADLVINIEVFGACSAVADPSIRKLV